MIKEEYITKEYFDKTLDKKLENFVTKDYLDEKFKDIKQHMTDLKTGFKEDTRIIYDQVKSLGDKIDRVDEKVSETNHELAIIKEKIITTQDDILLIKDVLVEKTDKRETSILKRRVTRLRNRDFI
ncbi:MAG: hypothetical protein Q7S72_01155 [Candidatus Taylorbacteria bacterium]|nr:hypothetical protein [Candidatus Taylorbacteria bacterium]